ncbi:cilia- and flagella-associated protein 36 [Xenentodon cancila]
MAEDDSDWIVESIVGYLGSPEWVVPVTDFMENRCTVFDDEDENKLSYTEIHQQYKKLVEKLLENYMQEVGIDEQQFLQACTSPFAKSQTLQTVFQPVLATDDFQMFRSLMVQKNMELQLQALRVMKERNGALPECLTDGVDVMTELQQQEMKILEEVLKKSKEEYDLEMTRRLLSEEEVGSASSGCSDKPVLKGDEDQRTAAAPGNSPEFQVNSIPLSEEGTEKASTRCADERNTVKSSSKPKSDCGNNSGRSRVLPALRAPAKSECSTTVSPHTKEESNSRQDATDAQLEEAHRDTGFSKLHTESSAAQQEEVQQRALYLRQQRDKLQALKKDQQKSKQTSAAEEPPASPAPAPSTCPDISAEERKRLQKRKHLADKLKEEVIKK